MKKGRIGKKNKELYDLEINEHEAVIIRTIFDLACNKGFGGRRISSALIEKEIVNRVGKPFVQSTINTMLDNVAYLGILRSGETYSEIFPELQIIDKNTFDRIQEYRKVRRQNDSTLKENKAPTPSHGSALLSGIIYCGHCGHKLGTRAKRSNSRLPASDPNNKIIQIYMCNKRYYENKLSFTCVDGQSTYRAAKIDIIIDGMVKKILHKVKSGNKSDYIAAKYQGEITDLNTGLKHAKSLHESKNKEISVLKEKIIKTLMEDKDTTIFQEMINECRTVAAQLEEEVKAYEIKLAEVGAIKENIKKQYTQMVSWADIYSETDIETKKMIIAGIIEKITVSKGYKLKAELKIDKSQFENGMEFELES